MLRGLADAAAPVIAVVAIGILFLAWHTAGSWIPKRTDSLRLLRWWLIGLAALWVAAVAITAEYIWLAFLLWLLAGHLLPGRGALVFSVVVYAVSVVAPILHYGQTTYPNIFGPLIGGVFALGISRGYLELLRESEARQQLVNHLTRPRRNRTATRRTSPSATPFRGVSGTYQNIARYPRHRRPRVILHPVDSPRRTGPQSRCPTTSKPWHIWNRLPPSHWPMFGASSPALAPAELDDDGLASALQGMLDRLHATTGIHTELRTDATLPALTPDAKWPYCAPRNRHWAIFGNTPQRPWRY